MACLVVILTNGTVLMVTGLIGRAGDAAKEAPSPVYISDFLATSEGLSLTMAFMRIKQPKLKRRIVDLVEEIADLFPQRQ